MKKLSPKERTLQSIKDGFGGDSYRRIEVSHKFITDQELKE